MYRKEKNNVYTIIAKKKSALYICLCLLVIYIGFFFLYDSYTLEKNSLCKHSHFF